jgi:hypothetical protein
MRRTIGLFVAGAMLLSGLTLASAAALRTAHLGDRVGVLTVGLIKTQGGAMGINCADVVRFSGVVAWYTFPGREPGEDNASVSTLEVAGFPRLAATFDENDLNNVVQQFVLDAHGTVVWVGPDGPLPVEACKHLTDLK